MNPATPATPTSHADLAALAHSTASELARWTFGLAGISIVIKLALAGG